VVGHVSAPDGTPGALADLADVPVGARVSVTWQGRAYRYRVERVDQHPRSQLPADVYDTASPHRLFIVSCTRRVAAPGGGFAYTHNVVVRAKRVKKNPDNRHAPGQKKQ
jgi:sortase (surface protein transpeptidase)